MSNTPRGAPELVSGQAVPETIVNEQIRRTEAGAARFPVADRVTAPPGSCADGATYLIIATATGAFAGKENQLATAVGTNAASGWYYRTLGTIDEGTLAYVQDEDAEYKWNGSAWVTAGSVSSGAITSSGLTMATSRVLGRTTASTGAIEELTLSQVLDLIGSAAQGDILYRGAAAWARLGAGTAGNYLQTQGAGANPAWATVSGSGGTSSLEGAKVRKSANLTGQNLTGAPTITWNSEDWDTGGYHDNASNTDRLTPPAAGYYQCTAQLELANTGTGNFVTLVIHRYNSGGVTQEVIASQTVEISVTGTYNLNVTGTGSFTVGDYAMVKVLVESDTSTDITTASYLEIRRIG